jgi:hypothetical protein
MIKRLKITLFIDFSIFGYARLFQIVLIMEEKKKKHGGARPNSGRKPKRDEEKVIKLGINAIEEIYGSQEEFFFHMAKQSKESFPHLKLLCEYVYGKPKEKVEHSASDESVQIPVISWIKKEENK